MTIPIVTNSPSTQFLDDYCPHCNPAGHYADSRSRLSTLTEPTAMIWHGGNRLVCEYHCDTCGHEWKRTDLWTAQHAGFNPKQPRRKGA